MSGRGVNKVILLGNLAADPDYRILSNGDNCMATVNMATNESYKDQQGVMQDRTEWHRLVFWGRLAEIAHTYLRKGAQIYVEGKIRTRNYEDQSGQRRYITEIQVTEMQMLGSKAQSQQDAGYQNQNYGSSYGGQGGGYPNRQYGGQYEGQYEGQNGQYGGQYGRSQGQYGGQSSYRGGGYGRQQPDAAPSQGFGGAPVPPVPPAPAYGGAPLPPLPPSPGENAGADAGRNRGEQQTPGNLNLSQARTPDKEQVPKEPDMPQTQKFDEGDLPF